MYSEPNEALSYWYSLFKSVLNSHASLKKRRVKREFIPEWFNSEIQAAIATRNHLHRKAILTNDALNWREYRSARNRVVHLRACLHGVGDPGQVGLVSFVFTLWRTQNKRNLPHHTGVPHSM